MTQPDRPDRAAAEQLGQDRVAAQLRHAARTYEPDGERIRRLIDARSAATGGAPIKTHQSRGLGGRAVMWPVVGSAAAAAVILAVAASGAAPGGQEPAANATITVGTRPADGSGDPATTALSSPMSTNVSPSSTVAPTSSVPPSGSPGASGHPSAAHVTVTANAPGGGPDPAHPRAAGGAGPAPGAGPAAGGHAGPALPQAGATSGTFGGRQVTAVVQPVAAGQDVTLGRSGEHWVIASAVSGPAQEQSAGNGSAIGTVQAMAGGAVVEPGPFRVAWQNGSPTVSGTQSSWLTVPAGASASTPLIRIPVRFKTDTPTIVLYVGTIGGGGRLEISVPGSGALSVNLPGCPGTCGHVVTITSIGGPGIPTTGDLPVDVFAVDASKVAIAAASLS